MKIIYEDKHIIVCVKQSGLAVQTARVGEQDMVSLLKNHTRNPYLGVVHRLDQPVEGLLVFAKTKEAAAGLSRQLTKGSLNKRYYSVVCGKPKKKSGELVDYLYKDSGNARAVVVTGNQNRYPDAKRAALTYRVIQETDHPIPAALADIHIETGRFHQIRAQMAFAGMPLIGDRKYAGEEGLQRSLNAGIKNTALCAYQLVFFHPIEGKRMEYEIKPEGEAFGWFLF